MKFREDDRFGKFKIRETEDTDVLKAVFDGVIPVRVELMYINREFECIGWHEDFLKVAPGMITPEYIAEIEAVEDEDGNKIIRRRWIKQ